MKRRSVKIPKGGLAGEIARKLVKKPGAARLVVEAVAGAGLLTGLFVAWEAWDPAGFKKRMDDALGDPIEMLHGHKCGKGCWHHSMCSAEKQCSNPRCPYRA